MQVTTKENSVKTYRKDQFMFWYDRSLRLWVCIQVDVNEFQVGNAGYSSSKDKVIDECIYVNQYCN